jgi:hypothetical protein
MFDRVTRSPVINQPEQGTRVIQRAVVTPFTRSQPASAAVTVDVEVEVLELPAACDIRCGRVADELPLVGLAARRPPARRDLHTVLIHGRCVAALVILQRCAGHNRCRELAFVIGRSNRRADFTSELHCRTQAAYLRRSSHSHC